jgi:hypothetical protein
MNSVKSVHKVIPKWLLAPVVYSALVVRVFLLMIFMWIFKFNFIGGIVAIGLKNDKF